MAVKENVIVDNMPDAAGAKGPGKAASYHHGDLRAALIRTARLALETTPPEAIQLKALAQQLGVSQPAPYRHFGGRDALMAAVAADGFDRLLAALMAARDAGVDALALERLCLAYVAFAVGNLGVYRLMFTRAVLNVTMVDEDDSSDASFKLLAAEVARRVGSARAAIVATTIWATLHGAVGLRAEGLLSGPNDMSVTVDAIAREIVAAFTS